MPAEKQKAIVRAHFDDYASSWHFRLGEYQYHARREAVKNMLQRMELSSVVDIGCGTGDYAALFDIRAISYLGLDNSPRMIEECKQYYPDYSFQVGDAESTGLPSAYCDLALSIAVLEYLEAPERHFAELARIVKRNGFVITAVPNADNQSNRRNQNYVKKLSPFFKLKRALLGPPHINDTKSAPRHKKDPRVFHRAYALQVLRLLGEQNGLVLIDAQFVNLKLIPYLFPGAKLFNSLLCRALRGTVWNNVRRCYASILVAKFQKT